MRKVKLELYEEVKPVWNAEWFGEERLVKIKIQKFKREIGRWFCRILKKPDYFIINLDELGSLVWRKCDGEKNVGELLKEIAEEMGEKFEAENMKKRIFLFLHMLHRKDLIALQL